jgi:hypothetical protein
MVDVARVHQIRIHPAIGIARVGNSPDGYFIGPEIPGTYSRDPSDFRDEEQRIKRQVARFHLFALDKDGNVLGEVTARDVASITWRAHVANTKAAWFRFDEALDVPPAMGQRLLKPGLASARRNASITGAAREHLKVDPGERCISGCGTNSKGGDARYGFGTGEICGTSVYLGELRTDDAGRLLFFGGMGKAASWNNSPLGAKEFANNDGWYDDVADGPVDAVVQLNDGRKLEAEGAWVLVAPPDYAPGIHAIVTGYDLIGAVSGAAPLAISMPPSFARCIWPLLARLSAYQWCNAGFLQEFGWGSRQNFFDPDLIERLANPDPSSRPLREAIFGRFRDPRAGTIQASSWPAVYGDTSGKSDPMNPDSLDLLAVLPGQYDQLRAWADGDFSPVLPTKHEKTWGDMSPAEKAAGLDEAALENTVGGPFHPGAEFTWSMRHPSLYSGPFRIKRRQGTEPDWGGLLTGDIALRPGGVLDGSGPGDLTRWMAVPWQTDASSCLSAYTEIIGQYLPTYWPARVPNDVLTEADYRIVMNNSSNDGQRLHAFGFAHRRKWLRGIDYVDPANPRQRSDGRAKFVAGGWYQVGTLVEAPGPTDSDLLPDKMWVETGRTL